MPGAYGENLKVKLMAQETMDYSPQNDVLQMTTKIVSAYVGHHSVDRGRIPDVIKSVYSSLAGLNDDPEGMMRPKQKPAVPIKQSITPNYLICLEDGKKFKIMKRHLRDVYGLSPEQYRAKWRLGPDYPMVAPNYAKQRSIFAKKTGLGKRRP